MFQLQLCNNRYDLNGMSEREVRVNSQTQTQRLCSTPWRRAALKGGQRERKVLDEERYTGRRKSTQIKGLVPASLAARALEYSKLVSVF